MRTHLLLLAMGVVGLMAWTPGVQALSPALRMSEYGHTSWTQRDGFHLGAIFAMALTPDGYLWLGSEFGLFRFDGQHASRWQFPGDQALPAAPYALLVTRDGSLWIGTFAGLASWNDGKLTQYPETHGLFVTSLLEDHEGTVWAGTLGGSAESPTGQLCAVRTGKAQCYLNEGGFGSFVSALAEDGFDTLWADAESGLWQWKPGPPRRFASPAKRIDDLSRDEGGRLLIAIRGAELEQVAPGKLETYPIHSLADPSKLLPDHEIDSNKLLRDRDGGLWIGSHDRGLIHVHNGKADVFTTADGLSGEIICSLFEDHEGNVRVATTRGLDRFLQLPVTALSVRPGLADTKSLITSHDGSAWIATYDGLMKWDEGRTRVFGKADGLPDAVSL